MSTLEAHPLAEIFPMAEGEDLQKLAADIKEHGQREPIVRLDGKVLDGRCRLKACEAAGVEPTFIDFAQLGDIGTPLDYVISKNLHRRHLTTSQRAQIAADLVPRYKAAAEARMKAGKTPKRQFVIRDQRKPQEFRSHGDAVPHPLRPSR